MDEESIIVFCTALSITLLESERNWTALSSRIALVFSISGIETATTALTSLLMLVLTLPILISPLITLADAFSMPTFFNFKESNFTCEFRKGEDEVGSNIEFRVTAPGIGGSEVLTAVTMRFLGGSERIGMIMNFRSAIQAATNSPAVKHD